MMAPERRRVIQTCGCVAVLWLAATLGAGAARASPALPSPALPSGARPLSVTLLRATALDRTPAGRPIAVIKARDGFGEATRLPVLARRTGRYGVWLLVRVAIRRGWVPLAGTYPSTSAPRRPGLVHALGPILATPGTSVLVTALDGEPLYAHGPTTPRILASNTKLFTTAAAVARYGASINPLLMQILPYSNNQLAQQLSDRLGGGSPARGAGIASRFACSLGPCAGLYDGSGLDPRDIASPRAVVNLLAQMRFVSDFRGWVRAFPVSGVSGTLAARMHGVARGRCQAKTGTLFIPLVSTLSGYCHTLHHEIVVFSILMNGVDISSAHASQDRAVAEIVRLG
ncbi:MAG: hypothetical protein DLM64_05205 [Solirubrobacterales bacterium]|nr:MAG: hypothetical protein DLM64_05205 [Solirubrobacterales bacterium]